jgi:hypothetical protein
MSLSVITTQRFKSTHAQISARIMYDADLTALGISMGHGLLSAPRS